MSSIEILLALIILIILTISCNTFLSEEFALAAVQGIEKEVNISRLAETKEDVIPLLSDPHLKAEMVFTGIEFPSNMAFLAQDDILVLEKNNGTVNRILNGQVLDEPLLSIDVKSDGERGMLGIAYVDKENSQRKDSTTNNNTGHRIFLYMTEEKEDEEVFNRLYRYDLSGNKLINPKLLMELPGTPGARHNGGEIIVGPDGNIYTMIGDVNAILSEATNTEDKDPDGRSGILRVTQNGEVVESIIGNEEPANKYFGYGIRNGFGMDFDPVTGNLWDTENGEEFSDEINLVEPGFNSGWNRIQGLGKFKDGFDQNELVDFDGKGEYSDPRFVWNNTVGVTAIRFLNSDKYGQEYENDLFVGDFNNGNLYHFELNEDRTELMLEGDLQDKVANDDKELYNVTFGAGFGGITDMEVGPDGYLYLLSLYEGSQTCDSKVPLSQCVDYSSGVKGTIFRIVPVA